MRARTRASSSAGRPFHAALRASSMRLRCSERGQAAADRQALVHQRAEHHFPAGAFRPQAMVVGNAHVVEEDLVELVLVRHLVNGPDLDARRLHVHDEHGQAFLLGLVPVAARQQDAVVAEVGARGPHLLPVDHPLVALARGARADAAGVRARRGFREELAPDRIARESLRDVALAQLRQGPHGDRGQALAEAVHEDLGRHQVVRFLLAVDHLLDRRAAGPPHSVGQVIAA